MLETFEFEMYPNDEQASKLITYFGHVRYVYNYFLEYSQNQYELGNNIDYNDWPKILTSLKKDEDHLWLNDVEDEILQQALKDLQDDYDKYFKKQNEHPKFKKKRNRNSFRVVQGISFDIKWDANLDVMNSNKNSSIASFIRTPEEMKFATIYFAGFQKGIIFLIDKKIPKDYNIKDSTIIKTSSDKYFVSISFETDTPTTAKTIKV